MQFSSNKRSRQTGPALCLGLALTFTATVPAFADGPWLSGASTIAIGEKATFSGGGFTPGQALTLQVTDAQGGVYTQPVVANAEGAVTYEAAPTVDGFYTLTVVDSSGNTLASTGFGSY